MTEALHFHLPRQQRICRFFTDVLTTADASVDICTCSEAFLVTAAAVLLVAEGEAGSATSVVDESGCTSTRTELFPGRTVR